MAGLKGDTSRGGPGTLWLLLVAICLITRSVEAQTLLPDTLRPPAGHRLVLEPSGNPYYASTMTYLLAGDTLELRPGVEMLFANSVGLVSFGTLLFNGNKDSLITLDRQPEATMRWLGISFRHDAVSDTTVSRLNFTKVNNANTVINANYPSISDSAYSIELKRCIFINASLGVVALNRGYINVENCLFDEISTFSVYSSGRKVDIKNSIFLPHSVNYWNYGIMFFNPQPGFSEDIKYNCFYSGADGAWVNFISYYNTGDQVYINVDPDSTHVLADPLLDEDYMPLDGSPVIDAGDPTMLDADETVVDIGVFYAAGTPVPCRFLTNLDQTEWVVGYPYLAQTQIEAYPPAQWSLSGAPPGMTLSQVGRSRLALNWPASQQLEGQFTVMLRGQNEVDGQASRDSLQAVLDFVPNHAPRLVRVEPCPQGNCLDSPEITVSALSTGAVASVKFVLEDEDEQRLGAAQTYEFALALNGATPQLFQTDSLSFDLVLDTTRVDLDLQFSDGLTGSALAMHIVPLYTLLEGEVEGRIGAATGAVFLTNPISVPLGKQLVVEAGSRIVSSNSAVDEWLLDIQGSVTFEGRSDAPITIQSFGEHSDEVDRRPPGMRIAPGSQVEGLAHVRFEGFSTAIQVEHREDPLPLIVDHCEFERCRTGLLAVGSPVEVSFCRFSPPEDSLQLGASGIYLSASEGNQIHNNLFLNPQVGVSVVDAEARISNNSFLVVPAIDPVYHVARWPQIPYLGFGRIHIFNSQTDVRNNLIQWRSVLYGDYFTEFQLEDYLDGGPRGVFLDEASQVNAEYNWFDCQNGMMLQGDTLRVSMTHLMAFNDSLRLQSDVRAGVDSSRVDVDNAFRLFADSPLINAGDPGAQWFDAFDGSRADIGWMGGPWMVEEGGYTPVDGFTGPEGDGLPSLPSRFRLGEAHPNPFNPTTRLDVELQQGGLLDVRVYDLLGRERAVLANSVLDAGIYQLELKAGGWPSGPYFVRARFGGEDSTRPLLLVK